MAKNKTSETITAEADALQAKLALLRKEARKMKKLEEQQEAEAKRQKDIAYALEFVEFAKQLHFQNGTDSYFDYIAKKLAESKATVLPTGNATQSVGFNSTD